MIVSLVKKCFGVKDIASMYVLLSSHSLVFVHSRHSEPFCHLQDVELLSLRTLGQDCDPRPFHSAIRAHFHGLQHALLGNRC